MAMTHRITNMLLLTASLLLAMSTGAQVAGGGDDPGAAKAAATKAADGDTSSHPPIIRSMEADGLEVVGQFDAPSGLRGYAGIAGGQPLAVYATPDGRHALVGMLIDMQGKDVGAEPLQRLVSEPLSKRIWSQLEGSHWIADGKQDAARIVYTFSDPNCPYCNRFWKAARPWVDAGKVQLRHIMVGVIRADSPMKVAAMFQAASPSQALESNERTFANGGIKPATSVSGEVRKKLEANEQLMTSLGFQGTPGILFRDDKGMVQTRAGLPTGDDLSIVLGPR